MQKPQVRSWVGKISQRRAWQPTPVGWRIPRTAEPGGLQSVGSQESDTTEHTHTHVHICQLFFLFSEACGDINHRLVRKRMNQQTRQKSGFDGDRFRTNCLRQGQGDRSKGTSWKWPEVTATARSRRPPEPLLAHLVLGQHQSRDGGLALLIVLSVKLEYSSLAWLRQGLDQKSLWGPSLPPKTLTSRPKTLPHPPVWKWSQESWGGGRGRREGGCRVHVQLVLSSRMAGIRVRFRASLIIWFQPVLGQLFSSGGCLLSVKTALKICFRLLSITFRDLGVQRLLRG